MKIFKELYLYEMKKIVMRKIVWIATSIMLAATVYVGFMQVVGNDYSENGATKSKYEIFQQEKEYEQALSGRIIDDVLLKEMQEAYAKIPDVKPYNMTEEYQKYARPYSAIHNYVMRVLQKMGSEDELLTIDAEHLYQMRMDILMKDFQTYRLTKEEIAYWQAQEQKIEKPFIYSYIDGYERCVAHLYSMNMVLMLLITVCLSPVFADEHTRRTDQLILCSRYGRGLLYKAKMAAGISFAVAEVLLFGVVFISLKLAVYGIEGFAAPVQLQYLTSHQMTMGQLVMVMYGLLLVAGILYSVMVMTISEMSKSNVAAIGVMILFLMVSMFGNIPEQFRVAGQVFDMLPLMLITYWGVLDVRLVPILGGYLTLWQAALALYIVVIGVLSIMGKRWYCGYEISGR